VRREAAEGFFALYAGRVHTARHGVQDGKKARWVVGRSLTLECSRFSVQGLPGNEDQPESCTQVLAYIPSFYGSTRALTQAEPHLAVAPERFYLLKIFC